MESPFRQGDLTDPALRLIETLGWDGSGFPRIDLHMARLASAAGRLGWPCAVPQVLRALQDSAPGHPARMRLTLDRAGRIEVQASAMPAPAGLWRIALAPERLDAADPWLTVKSTRRAAYDNARARLPPGLDEVVFANAAGQVCDGSIATLFFDTGDGLCTPPLANGLLPGVLRAELLDRGRCREAALAVTDLPQVRLWMGNSLRGLIPAVWAGAG